MDKRYINKLILFYICVAVFVDIGREKTHIRGVVD